MKNLIHYTGSSFEFHKEVLNKKNKTKKDLTYKNRIESLNDIIESQFLIYDDNFVNNSLENIACHRHTVNEKKDLFKLYSYKSSVIKRLKINLTTTDTKRIINTCPNCTISEINSFDHLLPKEEYPEFVVNPKNLFPSCTTCNSYKNDIWRKDDKRLFLNLYLDILPNEQYLYVDLIFFKDNTITTNFYLQNNGNIEGGLFDLITTHYNKLHLLERFSNNCNEVITSLENLIGSFIKVPSLSLEEIRKISIEKYNQDRLAFGYNYWKSILEISLLSSDEYVKRFLI